MRWLITGSRHGTQRVARDLDDALLAFDKPTEVVVGCATGVDSEAREWAKRKKIPYTVFHAGWGNGGGDGPRRNQRMVDYCDAVDMCIAFPVGESRGTKDCAVRAHRAGMSIRCIINGYMRTPSFCC